MAEQWWWYAQGAVGAQKRASSIQEGLLEASAIWVALKGK